MGGVGVGVLALEQGGLQAGKAQAGPEICFLDVAEPAAAAASEALGLGTKAGTTPSYTRAGRPTAWARALPRLMVVSEQSNK